LTKRFRKQISNFSFSVKLLLYTTQTMVWYQTALPPVFGILIGHQRKIVVPNKYPNRDYTLLYLLLEFSLRLQKRKY